MTTFTPECQPKINEWLRFVSTPVLNLNLIDSDTILGKIIIAQYPESPYETVKMIRELYPDNPSMMTEVISNHNCKILGL